MPDESKEIKEPKKEASKTKPKSRTCSTIAVWVIVAIAVFLVAVWIYNFYDNIKDIGSAKTAPTPTATPTAVGPLNIKSASPGQVETAGNWTLTMTSPVKSTGPETSLTGTDTGTVSFKMPTGSEKVEATGDFSGEGSGTVGVTNPSSKITGKMNLVLEIKDNKLHFTVTYVPEKCSVNLWGPVGEPVDDCPLGSMPDPHTLDIQTQDGATITSNYTYPSSTYNTTWTENWTLNQK